MKLGKMAKQLLGSVAPLIGGAIGGPYGAAAGSFIKKALGTDDESEIEAQLASASPETLVKIKQADLDFKVQMEELGIQKEEIFLKDTQSARNMAINTSLTPQIILAAAFIGGYFIILILLLSGVISPADAVRDMALILLGVLAGEVPRIMSFFFGTTKSSGDKNQMIAALKKEE